jgi:uncharacterized repeat protein (TIGR01451 family)
MSRNFVRRIQSFTATMAFVALIAIFLPAGSLGQQRDTHPPREQSRRAESGSVSFLPAVVYNSGGSQPSFVAVADVNGDGKPDLLVANSYYSNSIGVLLGKGDGTFHAPVTFASGAGFPTGIVPVDINGDGKLDLIVFNETSCYPCNNNGSIAVLLGNGNGGFGSPTTYDTGGGGYGVIGPSPLAVIDVNGDGNLDVVVANCAMLGASGCGDGEGEVGVLLGNGDGTFRPVVVYGSGFSPGGNGLAVGDLNGDGKPDLIVTSACDTNPCPIGSVGVLLNNGDGTFQPSVQYTSAGYSALGIAVADLNHDGKLDVVLAGCLTNVCLGQPGVVTVLLGKGNGTFQPAVGYSTVGGFGDGVAVADLNGDGNPDVVVTNYDGSVAVLQGNGDGTFLPAVTFASGVTGGAYAVGVADVNLDGWPDVLVTGNPTALTVLINNTAAVTPTTTVLGSSLNPSNYGQTVTFTASVTSSSGTPSGAVVFYDGSTTIGSATLANGNASFGTSSLGGGLHSITAAYQGSSGFAPSTSPVLTQVVNGTGTATATSLTSSKNPGIYQQPVTFTAVVTSGSGTPTGTVVFYDGTATLASSTLVNGTASFTTSGLKRGWAAMTAQYLGSGSLDPSTSPVLYERVDKNGLFQTRIHLSSSNRNSYVGQAVTFTVSLAALRRGEIPQDGDQVQFFDDDNFIGYGTTQNGVASLTTTSLLKARHHIIGAYFPGDDDFSHAYTQITQIVNKYPTSVRVTASPNPALYGQAITFTATVTSAGPNTPTGSVKFKDIGEATLSGGVATFVKNSLRAGTHAVTAEYLGDADSGESTSPVLDEVVNPASTTTKITSSANPSSSGQTVTFTATVTSSTGLDPFGKVTFTAGGTTLGTVSLKDTVATVSTATLPVGTSTITATYNGSAGFTGSGASLTQTVNPRDGE